MNNKCKYCNTEFPKKGKKIFCTKKCSHAHWYSNPENKKRKKQNNSQLYSQNKERFSYAQLKFKYGITKEQYDTMFEKQNGLCAICIKKCDIKFRLSLDHDHVTGKVRGLLCDKCNKGLGSFKDNIDSLKNAIKYLEQQC